MTWRSRPAVYEEPIIQAAPLTAHYLDSPTPESRLKHAPVLNMANKIDVFEQAGWHRAWERLPIRFTVWVTIAVVVASAFSLVPTFLIRSNVPTIATVKPYTPLELMGRDIYVAEGCYNCHSQQIRPLFAETERYGAYSLPGESIYDNPFQWGSRRIGPDLSRQGGKNSNQWHYEHFRDPNSLTEGSVMSPYPHLLSTELNLRSLPQRVKVAAYLGAPYERELSESIEMAQAQAKQIAWELAQQGGPTTIKASDGKMIPVEKTQVIALIAYMQRLGVDLNAAPESEQDEASAQLSAQESASLNKYLEMLTPESLEAADAKRGYKIYHETCGKCHKLFGEGGEIGPELTGTTRYSLDYLLINIVAPSLEVPAAYQTEIFLTIDGDLLTGVVVEENDEKIIIMTAERPRVEIYQEDIEDRKLSKLSIMPPGQLDAMSPDEVRDLIKYLQLPKPLESTSTEE